MTEALASTAGLAGLLAFILGAFFLFTSFTPQSKRRRILAILGLMMMSIGVNFYLVYYTGGVRPYLENGGARAVARVVVGARGFTAFLALVLIIDSLRVWRRTRLKDERDNNA